MHQQRRRHDLDWLRVIAFGLLIFYHIGLLYVPWGYHVESPYVSRAPETVMSLLNPWRLSLLFFISGVAIRFAFDRSDHLGGFLNQRLVRLGVPIVFGVLVIVAPQSYFELRQDGVIDADPVSFYMRYARAYDGWDIIVPTWNHLWYVVYLLVYIVLLLPVVTVLGRPETSQVAPKWRWWSVLFVIPLPFVLYEFTVLKWFDVTMNLAWDWGNHALRFTMFLLGFVVAKQAGFWRVVDRVWPWALGLAVSLGAARGVALETRFDAWPDGLPYAVFQVGSVVYAWMVIVALLGLAQRFLNRPSAPLRYLTGAVFCYYIVHQTTLIAASYWLGPQRLGAWTEFGVVTAITFTVCAVMYEAVRRIPYLRIAFGVKPGG